MGVERGKVFTEFISQLGKLDASRRDRFEDSKRSVFADRIPDVESSLRSFEFHSRRLASIDKLLPESKTVRHNLYKETLRGCAGVKLSTDFGHVMRICALIMDCLSWHQNRSGGDRKDVEDITHIYSDIAIISGTCVENPYEYAGYSENNWGITASSNYNSYSAHSPTNDLGVIAPTAALSSFPYTPFESKKALEYFSRIALEVV